jgi:hypothetical protein
MVNLLNDVGHEGVHRSFHPLTHAFGIFCTGQQIPPMNADQLGQYDDHEQASESNDENGPKRWRLIRTRMVLIEVGCVLHDSDSVNQRFKKSGSDSEPGTPRPDQDVGQYSNCCKSHGALHPVVVKFLGFLIGESGNGCLCGH